MAALDLQQEHLSAVKLRIEAAKAKEQQERQ
jgi:hypothetical protein